MPMAGRGSRFAALGEPRPKPLIELDGLPFFVRATRGVVSAVPDARLTYVVLEEHVERFAIDRSVRRHFPDARVIAIPDVTSGSLETALVGADQAAPDTPLVINDCDHAFGLSMLPTALQALREGADGFLSHFKSRSPNYSFARYSEAGDLIQTAEKKPISDRAIAGVYGFRSLQTLRMAAESYFENCPYPELFVSGVYNEMVAAGLSVIGIDLDFHISFGTPEEYSAVVQSVEARRLLANA